MYIVFVPNTSESMVFEEKKEAFEYALSVSKELPENQVRVYKSALVATVELPSEPVLVKIKKQKIVPSKVFKEKSTSVVKAMKEVNKLTKPPLSDVLKKIAEDPEGNEEETVPLNARCELDNNIAVGRKKGPTGEYVYLCMDCMGEVNKNE